jgi:hypothetical protein
MDQAMKRSKLLLALSLVACTAQGQVWCPPGAEWWYEHWGNFGNQLGYVHLAYGSDTLIDGDTCQRLDTYAAGYDFWTEMPYYFQWAPLVTRDSAGVVYLRIGADWTLLFDINAPPGGEWSFPWGFPASTAQVTDTGHIVLSGQVIRYSVVSLNPPVNGSFASDTIFERMGYKSMFMDPSQTFTIDGDVLGLRCYADQDVDYSTDTSLTCDFILSIEQPRSHTTIGLFPNPASTWIQLTSDLQQTAIASIVDVNGRTLFTGNVSTHDQMNIAFLAPGYYMLRLSDRSGATLSHAPFMKE